MRNILRSISWLNNAGIPGDMSKTSWDTDMMDIKETTDVNYFGTLAITQALLPLIKQNEGRIVNVTVPSEISPYWHPLAYVASKAAQNAMMGVMAMEFKQNNIPVEIFSVHPGPTTTDLNGNEGWLRDVYNLLFHHPARDFSEWMARVDDTENRGRSINQGKSQINAYIKDRLKAFELDVSEMPIIDKMEDEHQDSYYTTYLQPEDIEIPEDFLSIPLSVR